MILRDLYPFYHQFLSHKIVQHQVALVVKNLSANTGEVRGAGVIPGALQYSCLENPTDRGAWKAMIHSIVKSWTWLKQLSSSSDSKKFWNGFSFLCLSYQELNTLYVYVYIFCLHSELSQKGHHSNAIIFYISKSSQDLYEICPITENTFYL